MDSFKLNPFSYVSYEITPNNFERIAMLYR